MANEEVKIVLVVTSINAGDVLDSYCKQAEKEGVKKQLLIIVIPDRKSPAELYQKTSLLRKNGFDIICPQLSEQEFFLKRVGFSPEFIPYDSDNRRNIGYLLALERNCDVIISIDDDNYCLKTEKIFKDYAVVCEDTVNITAVHSSNGWFNVCDLLEMEPNYEVYPRGFPYHKRHDRPTITFKEESGPVRLNAGLWIGEPDLDAITWLAAPVRAKSFKGESLLLGSDTWTPINTQNTSLHRDVVSSYYFLRMGYRMEGMKIDRYGDIFSGYFAQACVRHMGHRVRVGTPIALHERNTHNYMKDLTQELACILILEDLVEWLREVKLEGNTYGEAYLSLAEALDQQVERFKGAVWNEEVRAYFHRITYFMRQWVSVCSRIMGERL